MNEAACRRTLFDVSQCTNHKIYSKIGTAILRNAVELA